MINLAEEEKLDSSSSLYPFDGSDIDEDDDDDVKGEYALFYPKKTSPCRELHFES